MNILRLPIVLCIPFLTMTASAGLLNSKKITCGTGSPCASTARIDNYEDDCNPRQGFTIVHGCDCSTYTEYWKVAPPVGEWYIPGNWDYLYAHADWSTPGGDPGIYVIDSQGDEIRFRNPYPGEAEKLCIQ